MFYRGIYLDSNVLKQLAGITLLFECLKPARRNHCHLYGGSRFPIDND
jgi:hypothetical protein